MTSEESQVTEMVKHLKVEEKDDSKRTKPEGVPPPDEADGNQDGSSANDSQQVQENQNVQGDQDGEAVSGGDEEKKDEGAGKAKEDENESNNEENRSKPGKKSNKGLVGINSKYVKLVSSDNHEFVIRRSLAEKSKTILEMLNGPNVETDNTVHFRMINSGSMSTLCRYLQWQDHYLKNNGEVETFDVEPTEAMDLFLLAGYLNI